MLLTSSNEIDSQMKRRVVLHDDVLLNITGASIGRVARFGLKGVRAKVNQHVCIISPKHEVLISKYLEYYLSSPRVQHDIQNRHQHGGTRQALTFAQISDFEIPFPPRCQSRSGSPTSSTKPTPSAANGKKNSKRSQHFAVRYFLTPSEIHE